MSLIELLYKRAEVFAHGYLGPPAQPRLPTKDVYAMVYLHSARLRHSRRITKVLQPVVHAGFKYMHVFEGEALREAVPKSDALAGLGEERVIIANLPLLGPIPYLGGGLGLQLGLFAVEARDLAAPFIDILAQATALLGGPRGGANISELVKQALAALSGLDEHAMAAGIRTHLDTLVPGYYVVTSATQANLPKARLETMGIGDFETAPELNGKSYVVLRIAVARENVECFRIEAIRKAYQACVEACNPMREKVLEEARRKLRWACLSSPELLIDDAERIANDLDVRILKLTGEAPGKRVPTSAGGGIDFPPLEKMTDYARDVSATEFQPRFEADGTD